MRTTVDLEDEAYLIAKSIAHDKNTSLGKVISKLIIDRVEPSETQPPLVISPVTGLLTFRSYRRATTADVKALEDDI